MDELTNIDDKEINDSRELRRDYRERKDNLRQDYREHKQVIKARKEASMTNVKGRVKNHLSGFIRAVVVGLLILMQFLLILYLPLFLRHFRKRHL